MHLQDVGDLSSPALETILRRTAASATPPLPAPSPTGATEEEAAAETEDSCAASYASDGGSLAGANVVRMESSASLSSLLSADLTAQAGLAKNGGAGAIRGADAARGSAMQPQAYLRGVSELDVQDGAESPAASPSSSYAAGHYRSTSITSPLSAAQRARARSGGGAASENSSGDTAAVMMGLSETRQWVPSPISAVGKEDTVVPWASMGAGKEESDADGDVPAGEGGGAFGSGGQHRGALSRRHHSDSDFDEEAFAEQESRMRHAYMQRMESMESASTPRHLAYGSNGGRSAAVHGKEDSSLAPPWGWESTEDSMSGGASRR